jgi:hypothetical protein
VPSRDQTADITVAFGSTTNNLYAGIIVMPIVGGTPRVNILRTTDALSPTAMTVLVDRMGQGVDQPFVQATSVNGQDRVFVGNNDFNGAPDTATVDLSTNAGGAPAPFNTARIESRSTGPANQDGPSIRPAISGDGQTVYAAYLGWRNATSLGAITSDVVVVRDDAGGAGNPPFSALKDTDGQPGKRVVQNIQFNFNAFLGLQRVGGDLSIAVHPRNRNIVYVAYADVQSNKYTLHLRQSTDAGVNWSADMLRVAGATNPAVAVNSNGTLGFLYQQLSGTGKKQRWITHLQRTDDGQTWNDLVLATVPALTPPKQFDPYIGDYDHLQAVGTDFYGIFCANNTPDHANFPSGVAYQRNADFNRHVLLDLDGTSHVQVSIDPFFFHVPSQ